MGNAPAKNNDWFCGYWCFNSSNQSKTCVQADYAKKIAFAGRQYSNVVRVGAVLTNIFTFP